MQDIFRLIKTSEKMIIKKCALQLCSQNLCIYTVNDPAKGLDTMIVFILSLYRRKVVLRKQIQQRLD